VLGGRSLTWSITWLELTFQCSLLWCIFWVGSLRLKTRLIYTTFFEVRSLLHTIRRHSATIAAWGLILRFEHFHLLEQWAPKINLL
jgi:hypothetical protein